MGKNKYNWKARKVVNTVVDDSTTKAIKVDLDIKGNYDASNELALPSKKRKTKIKDDKAKVTRILSNKHRKRLEKIVDRKKKKENRANLLESLQKVQATNEELSQLTSIASVQTKGLKRYFQEELNPEKVKNKKEVYIEPCQKKLNSISGAKRRKLLQESSIPEKKAKISDPNVVGFDSDNEESSDSSSSSETDEVTKTKEETNGLNEANIVINDKQKETNDKSQETKDNYKINETKTVTKKKVM